MEGTCPNAGEGDGVRSFCSSECGGQSLGGRVIPKELSPAPNLEETPEILEEYSQQHLLSQKMMATSTSTEAKFWHSNELGQDLSDPAERAVASSPLGSLRILPMMM